MLVCSQCEHELTEQLCECCDCPLVLSSYWHYGERDAVDVDMWLLGMSDNELEHACKLGCCMCHGMSDIVKVEPKC